MEARINALRDKLARATLIDPAQVPRDQVAFGATVRVKDLAFGDEEAFTLVGAGEEDYDAGKILVTSPLAQGLLGKKPGDKVEIAVPQGTLRFEISRSASRAEILRRCETIKCRVAMYPAHSVCRFRPAAHGVCRIQFPSTLLPLPNATRRPAAMAANNARPVGLRHGTMPMAPAAAVSP